MTYKYEWEQYEIKNIYPDVEFTTWGNPPEPEKGSEREKQTNDLEERYEAALKAFDAEINELRTAYCKAYEAYRDGLVKAAEKYGVPTQMDDAHYVPNSMKDIFGDGNRIDPLFISDIRQTGGSYSAYDSKSVIPPGKWWAPSTC